MSSNNSIYPRTVFFFFLEDNYSLSPSVFRRLHSNNLHCDCHLSWLSDWLRARRGLAPFTQCMAPAHMRGLNVPDVQKKDFVCNGELTLNTRTQNIQFERFSESSAAGCMFMTVCVVFIITGNDGVTWMWWFKKKSPNLTCFSFYSIFSSLLAREQNSREKSRLLRSAIKLTHGL